MTSSYIPLLAMLLVTALVACGMVAASSILGPKKPSAVKSTPYECGMTPIGSARERFPIKFYLIAMVFIVFDIETIFLWPWVAIYRGLEHNLKVFTLVEMAVFVAILFVGYFYILGKGALDWDESEQARTVDVITPEVVAARPSLRYGNENSGPVDLGKMPVGARALSYGAASQEEGVVLNEVGEEALGIKR
jgi:NADH-quinone oxidoreductase subunit A